MGFVGVEVDSGQRQSLYMIFLYLSGIGADHRAARIVDGRFYRSVRFPVKMSLKGDDFWNH
jgi:hypothetical protein